MIPLIGFMIGAYIITRMIEIIINKETHGAVAVCAFITIIVTGFCLFGLLVGGITDLPKLNSPIPHN